MTKRFTATEKWADPWFFSLTPIEKLFWIYLLDNCNHAGIWDVNWPLANVHLGGEFVYDESKFKERIVILTGGTKWFIAKFVEFQYKGELNPDNRAHQSVIDLLKREGLWPLPLPRKEKEPLPLPGKPLARALDGARVGATHGATVGARVGAKDKEKDTEQEQDKATDMVLVKDKATDSISRTHAPARELLAPPKYMVECESCGLIESWDHHKHCHYCFKPFQEGVPNASHSCKY